ncbi:MAG: hypothetical protein HDT23_01430 [Ruminococcus sp.]|nr:hypothetical protein [Ruminococcus sp.]
MNLHEILFASKISGKSNGNADLSDYYTKSQTNSLIAGKVDKVAGKSLSTNDFTDEYKAKIDGTDKQITDKIAKIIANAPEDFDTLKEISDWIESHEDSASAMNTAINNKVDKVSGKGLSTNDFTTTLKNKLDGLSNYDDTSIKADIAEMSSQIALNRSSSGFQRKNLLKNTAVSGTSYGIKYTVNSDGSVTVFSGVANNTGIPVLVFSNKFTFKANVKYILSGAPDDSSSKTRIGLIDDNGGEYSRQDTGKGTLIEFDEDTTYRVRIRFCDRDGEVDSDKTFYPMIRYAEITDDTYEPYKPSVEERLIALETAILSEKGE